MNSIIYIVGLVVVILFIAGFLGLRSPGSGQPGAPQVRISLKPAIVSTMASRRLIAR